jgi:predicted MFS family arabinose efflux permease
MVGPIMGSMIDGLVGYEFTFVIFSVLLIFCNILVIFFIPKRLNNMEDEPTGTEILQDVKKEDS